MTYTTRDQLSTITAPGNKVWDFDYNALGEPTGYTATNGVETAYSYNSRNRLTKIEHIDGMVTLASFDYDPDDGGLITKTTQEDGSYWDYGYDNRYRLTSANRFESGGNIKAAYSYTYDAGDNMIADRSAARSAARQWPQCKRRPRKRARGVSLGIPRRAGCLATRGTFAAQAVPGRLQRRQLHRLDGQRDDVCVEQLP